MAEEEEEDTESGPGFVVTITGYSPYKDIDKLMDPVGVEGDPEKWGVITRLLHLDDVVSWENPFELYGKAKIKHFKLETGEVDAESEMPAGIGIEEDIDVDRTKKTAREDIILIDPMTREIISKVPELDEKGKEKTDKSGKVIYKANDHWFKLDVKFIWKDAPNETQDAAAAKKTAKTSSSKSTKKTEGTGKRRGSEEISLE